MSPVRIALHVVRAGALMLLVVQYLQATSALAMLDGPEPFAVSALLLAALAFKALWVLANLGVLWMAHRMLRRKRPALPAPVTRNVFNGEPS